MTLLKKRNTAKVTLFGTRINTDFTDKIKKIRVFPCKSVSLLEINRELLLVTRLVLRYCEKT